MSHHIRHEGESLEARQRQLEVVRGVAKRSHHAKARTGELGFYLAWSEFRRDLRANVFALFEIKRDI
jgi:hypothetical protein